MESGMQMKMGKESENELGLEITINKIKMDFHCKIREIVGKLRCEIEKRDKILDLLVSGGDVTLVNLDVDVDSQTTEENDHDKAAKLGTKTKTKTFEMLIKTVPFKVETVTLNPINWEELLNSFEKGSSEIPLFSQDVKPKTKPEPEQELKLKPTDVNVNRNIFAPPGKRRFPETESKIQSESDKTATIICQNQNQPVQKQAKLEEKESDCDFVCELPEFSMDKSFFESKNPSATTLDQKFLIRLHDNNTEQISLYDISHATSSKSISISSPKFQLSLQEIQAAISVQKSSNPGSKLEIWCDLKNFDIFSTSNSARCFFELFGEFVSHFTFSLGHLAGKSGQKGFLFFSSSSSSSSASSVDSNFLIRFILQNFPNLEFLSINSEMLTNLNDLNLPPPPKPLKLQKLKTLRIVPSTRNAAHFSHLFFAKLLKRAPQLEKIHGIPLNCIKETAELDKILMEDSFIQDPLNSIPKLKIPSCFIFKEIYYNQPHKFCEDLLNSCNLNTGNGTGSKVGRGRIIVALEEFNAQRYFIQDPLVREKAGPLMSRVLQLNRESLIKLTLEPNTNPQKAIQIPHLQNLKLLHFHFARANCPAFFPRGFQVTSAFPKLEQVVIHLVRSSAPQNLQNQNPHHPQSEARISPDFLRFGETFETVQSLALRFLPFENGPGSGSGVLLKIRSMFPNLTRLTLSNNLHDVSRFLQQVFQHFPHLHQLVLEIDTGSRHGNLDAALTGIKADLCKKLEKTGFVPCPIEGNGREKLIQIIQSGRSLSDLKELRLLKFVLRSGVTREFDIPVLTPVSFEYGLRPEQLKNVKIFLDFNEKTTREVKSDMLTALAPVLPFMTIL